MPDMRRMQVTMGVGAVSGGVRGGVDYLFAKAAKEGKDPKKMSPIIVNGPAIVDIGGFVLALVAESAHAFPRGLDSGAVLDATSTLAARAGVQLLVNGVTKVQQQNPVYKPGAYVGAGARRGHYVLSNVIPQETSSVELGDELTPEQMAGINQTAAQIS